MSRTTLILDDSIMDAARHRAIELNITLSELVNRALRDTLAPRTAPPSAPFRMTTWGSEGEARHRTPEDLKRALDEDERSAWQRADGP